MMKYFSDRLTPERQRKIIEGLIMLNIILLILGGIFAIKLNSITSANHRLAIEGAQAHTAICSYKKNLERRISNERKLLRDNPKAKQIDADPSNGVFFVSRDLIIANLTTSRSDLRATKDLICSKN